MLCVGILSYIYLICALCMCVRAWGGGACVQVCIWCCVPEANLRCLQLLFILVFEMGVSLTGLEFTGLLDWLASKPQYPLVSVPQN